MSSTNSESSYNSTITTSTASIDPLLNTSALFNHSSSSSSPASAFPATNPSSFYANCYAALSASTFTSAASMTTPPIMSGMNFFSLNSNNSATPFFGSSATSTVPSNKYEKYTNGHEESESIADCEHENDEDQMMGSKNRFSIENRKLLNGDDTN